MVVVTGNENKVSPMDNDLLDITKLRRWRIWKLKLIDARLYFVSIFVGLLTGLVAVPYHYLLQQLFNSRKLFSTVITLGISKSCSSSRYGVYCFV